MNPNGDGAKYRRSEEILILTAVPPRRKTATSPWPDIIAGILADWVRLSPFYRFCHHNWSTGLRSWYWMVHSFENIGSYDDWLEVG